VGVAREGIARSEQDGLEALHGNLLRGNAADFLFTLGEWPEALAFGERALSWAPTGIAFVNAAVPYVTLATEMGAADGAIHVLGRLLLELEKLADSQFAVPAYRAAAALALWQGDHDDARRSIAIAWERIRQTEDWVLGSMAASTALAVAMAQADAARERRDLAALAEARSWASGVLAEATALFDASRADPDAIARREAAAELATARAALGRIGGQDDPRAWAAVAERWTALRRPYDEARARFREAEARLASADAGGERRESRDDARGPLLAAAEVATRLRAVPLLRAIADLAARARLVLPAESQALLAEQPPTTAATATVGRLPAPAPPDDRPTAETFGLTPRERGVLAEIVAGRTNRVIGERLYISEKTVAVHVARILAKLRVSGRVEAATVALRLGLVDDLPAHARRPGPAGPGLDRRASRR
jgi:DNA-binding CsgD family transcriptional regulator